MLQSGMNPFSPSFVRVACGLALAFAHVPGHAQSGMARGLIVQLKPVTDAAGQVAVQTEKPQAARDRASALARSAGVALREVRTLNARHQVLQFAQPLQGQALQDALARMREQAGVAAVEPDVRVGRLATPNDPLYGSRQWNLMVPTSLQPATLNMPGAWDKTTGSAVTVAVLDTGVRPTHPDLAGKLLPGYDMVSEVEFANDGDGRDTDASDPGDWVSLAESRQAVFAGCIAENSSWHGTFIAGQIGAATHNAQGIAGVSWGARILPVRVSGKCGAFLSDIFDGLRWAAGLTVSGAPANPTPARIINLSFGGDAACTAAYQNVINEVTAAGALVVVAAGNEGGALRRPADCAGVMAVGGVRANGAKVSYSNLGSNMALMAPSGEQSLPLHSLSNAGTTGPGADTYGDLSGTSFAAPQAAGVAALMLSINPALTPAQLVSRMRDGANAHINNNFLAQCTTTSAGTCNCNTSTCGAGVLNGLGAAREAEKPALVLTPIGSLQPGTTVTLSAANSQAALGSSMQGFQWIQVSGTAVTLAVVNASDVAFRMPSTGGSFTFLLIGSDTAGRSSMQEVQLSASGTADGGASGGSGGGAVGQWGVLALLALVVMEGLRARRHRRVSGARR